MSGPAREDGAQVWRRRLHSLLGQISFAAELPLREPEDALRCLCTACCSASAPAVNEELPLQPGISPPTQCASPEGMVEETLLWLQRYKVVPILRSKDADLAILRGVELANLGCKALEVTLDTPEWERVVSSLVEKTKGTCLVGVGTVESVQDENSGLMQKVADIGGRFALSPFNPEGFIQDSLKCGVLPVPAAFTPQEIQVAMKQGAQVVKLFPAQLHTPDTLKAIRAVGSFGTKVHIMPSGGVTPQNVKEWIDVGGAFGVGLGSNLCGEDLRMVPENTPKEKIQAAAEKWRRETAPAAEKLFAQYP